MVILLWTFTAFFGMLLLIYAFISIIRVQGNITITGDEKSLVGLLSIGEFREASPLVLITIIPKIKGINKRLFTFTLKIELHNLLKYMNSPSYKIFISKHKWLEIMPFDLIPLTAKMKVNQFEINASVGSGDCALTGVLCGFYYSVLGSITAIILNSFKSFNGIKINASPDYQDVGLKFDFLCIVQGNLADIINGLIKIFYKKFKGRCKTC